MLFSLYMEVIDKLTNKYDVDTRKGLCNMILEYVYIDKIDMDKVTPSFMNVISTLWYLTVGRWSNPEIHNIYKDLFDRMWEEEERENPL